MSEIARMLDQLRRSYERQAWHGPSLREALAGVTPIAAASRPLPQAHTLWEIVLHIAAWEDVVRRRIEGQKVELTEAEDWPRVTDTSSASWGAALEKLERGHLRLSDAVAGFDERRLDEAPGSDRMSPYILIHGAVQHGIYHAGHIVLLRKAAGRA